MDRFLDERLVARKSSDKLGIWARALGCSECAKVAQNPDMKDKTGKRARLDGRVWIVRDLLIMGNYG